MIRKGLRDYLPGTTKLIIAQRVASVEDADEIIVMENGSIAERGSHDELISRRGIYYEVWESQTHMKEEA